MTLTDDEKKRIADYEAEVVAIKARMDAIFREQSELRSRIATLHAESATMGQTLALVQQDMALVPPLAREWLGKICEAGHLTVRHPVPEDVSVIFKQLDGAFLIAWHWDDEGVHARANEMGIDAYYRVVQAK